MSDNGGGGNAPEIACCADMGGLRRTPSAISSLFCRLSTFRRGRCITLTLATGYPGMENEAVNAVVVAGVVGVEFVSVVVDTTTISLGIVANSSKTMIFSQILFYFFP